MIGIPLGIVVQNIGQWFIHKHLLHGSGKKRASFWSFHFFEHHRASRLNQMIDEDYHRSLFGWNPQSKEALGLIAITALHLPLFPIAPFYVSTIAACNYRYYILHKRAHLDPDWAREHLPWHYDHHMGPNQDANWCVTDPWADRWFGTRIPYKGTAKEAADYARRQTKLKTQQAA